MGEDDEVEMDIAYSVLVVYLVLVAVWDLKTGRIPNLLTLPAMAGVAAYRVASAARLAYYGLPPWEEMRFVGFWAGVFVLWMLGVGGGDAKVLMVLFGIFPTMEFMATLLLVTGGVMVVVLSVRYARQGRLGMFFKNMAFRAVRWSFLPTRAEAVEGGEPTAFLFSLAAMVWLVLQQIR